MCPFALSSQFLCRIYQAQNGARTPVLYFELMPENGTGYVESAISAPATQSASHETVCGLVKSQVVHQQKRDENRVTVGIPCNTWNSLCHQNNPLHIYYRSLDHDFRQPYLHLCTSQVLHIQPSSTHLSCYYPYP